MRKETLKPRSLLGVRPVCEAVVPTPYLHRTYRARDCLSYEFFMDGAHSLGHPVGGYCLDRPEPVTGGHVKGDYVYRITPAFRRITTLPLKFN